LLSVARERGFDCVREFGEGGEEGVGGGDGVLDVFAVVDFLADLGGDLGGSDDGHAFPGTVGGPGGDAPGVRGGGEEVVEAGLEIGGEAELDAAGVFFGLELEEVEEAEVAGRIIG
jgi:hypothetical protein